MTTICVDGFASLWKVTFHIFALKSFTMFTCSSLLPSNWFFIIMQVYSCCFTKGFVYAMESHANEIFRQFNTLTFSKALPMEPATNQSCSYPDAFPFEPSQPGLLRVSAGADLFQNSFGCGLCIQIEEKFNDPAGKALVLTKTAVVVDYCRDCEQAHSLGYAFSDSSKDIVYKAVHCPTEEVGRRDIQLRLVRPSVRQLKIQILNARVPTARVDVVFGGHIRCLEHSKDNFFVLEETKEIPSTFMIGITSIAGEMLWQTIHIDEHLTKSDGEGLIDFGVQFIGIIAGSSSFTLMCSKGSTRKTKQIPDSAVEKTNARWIIRYPTASKAYPEIPFLNFSIYQSTSYRQSVHSWQDFPPDNEWVYFELKLTDGNARMKVVVESCEKESKTRARSLTRNRFITNRCPAIRVASFIRAHRANVRRLKVKAKWLLSNPHNTVVRCTVLYCPNGSHDPKCHSKCQDIQDFRHPNRQNSYARRQRRSEDQENNTSMLSSNAVLSTAAVKVRPTEQPRKASSFINDANYIVWFIVGTIAAIILGILFRLWRKKVTFRSVSPQCTPGNGRQVDYIVKHPSLPPNFTKI